MGCGVIIAPRDPATCFVSPGRTSSARRQPPPEALTALGGGAQHYVMRPLLIDGFKFDMRVYVLVSVAPASTSLKTRGGKVD